MTISTTPLTTTVFQKLIHRISISCAICITSDTLFGIGAGIHTEQVNSRNTFLLMFYNLNTTINVVAIIGSFNNWRCRLLPYLLRTSATRVQTHRANTSEVATVERATVDTPIKTPESKISWRFGATSCILLNFPLL